MSDLIDKYWYLTSQPWFKGDDVGTGILAGCEDPHGALWIADFRDMAQHLQEREPMLPTEAHDHVRELVKHVVETHNDWLDAREDAYRKSVGHAT